jgi:hypothetical protein
MNTPLFRTSPANRSQRYHRLDDSVPATLRALGFDFDPEFNRWAFRVIDGTSEAVAWVAFRRQGTLVWSELFTEEVQGLGTRVGSRPLGRTVNLRHETSTVEALRDAAIEARDRARASICLLAMGAISSALPPFALACDWQAPDTEEA